MPERSGIVLQALSVWLRSELSIHML